MPPLHDPPPKGKLSASGALLSAALGGLLWLSSACGPKEGGGDSGTEEDLGVHADGGADTGPADAGAPDTGTDAGTMDAGGDAGSDAGAADADVDAPPSMDAAVDLPSMDAAIADAGAPYDLARPDFMCDVDPLRTITASDAAPDMSLDDFVAMCAALGGFVEIHPHCGGMNSCAGISYDSNIGVITEHSCAGLNTCTGFSCVVP